jgi:ABC-2 type transport system ATP-binding protein
MTATQQRPVPPPQEDPPAVAGAAVDLQGLVKDYGGTRVLHGIDLVVERGQVFGFLGPNGAGKSTTLEIVAGLRSRSGGAVSVLGHDPDTERDALRTTVGLQPQTAELFPNLTARETLELWASFFARPVPPGDLLDRLGLGESADVRVHALSGGQERRLLVATALVGSPELVVLDEPSTGLDPNSRAELWEVVIAFRDAGGTVLLSTHSMEEADALCDRVVVVQAGRVLAQDSPRGLVSTYAPEQVVTLGRRGNDPAVLQGLPGVVGVDVQGNRVLVRTADPDATVRGLLEAGGSIREIAISSPSLDTVFRQLTGGATGALEGSTS